MISALIDPEPLCPGDIIDLVAKLKQDGIGTITPEYWLKATGRSPDELASFVKERFVIHDIRAYLAGSEHIGACPKLLLVRTPGGNVFYLVSLKPNVSAGIQ